MVLSCEVELIPVLITFFGSSKVLLVKDKKVKKHLIQMLVGKVMSGEVRDIIDIDRFIKRLKKRMKVETL